MRRTSITDAGFTLVEFMVTVVLIVLLVAMALPVADSVRSSKGRDRILELAERCRAAVRRHYADTGQLAVECSGVRSPSSHGLTRRMGVPGWRGPYLDHFVDLAEIGATGAEIRADFSSGPCRPWGECFLVGRPRAVRLTGPGQYLALTGISEARAREVDGARDGDAVGDWRREGEVQWRAARGGTLMILLMDV